MCPTCHHIFTIRYAYCSAAIDLQENTLRVKRFSWLRVWDELKEMRENEYKKKPEKQHGDVEQGGRWLPWKKNAFESKAKKGRSRQRGGRKREKNVRGKSKKTSAERTDLREKKRLKARKKQDWKQFKAKVREQEKGGKDSKVDRGILLTTVEWEMGFWVTLLQQIAAWYWLMGDSYCFFLTYKAF